MTLLEAPSDDELIPTELATIGRPSVGGDTSHPPNDHAMTFRTTLLRRMILNSVFGNPQVPDEPTAGMQHSPLLTCISFIRPDAPAGEATKDKLHQS